MRIAMKSCAAVACLSVVFGTFAASVHAKELKVGVADVEKIYGAYEKAKASAAALQAEAKVKQDEAVKKQAELKALQDEYAAKSQKRMSEEEKKQYEKRIADKKVEVQAYVNAARNEVAQKRQAVTRERLAEIAKVIQDHAQQNGYDLIVDKKSLPFFSSALDVSDTVIKILNASEPKK